MKTKSQYLINQIYEKLKNYNIKQINLEKEEFEKFIFFLINNS